MEQVKHHVNKDDKTAVEALPGIFRTTLAYNPEVMLCHFTFKAGSSIPQHRHPAAQIGYVIRGSIDFTRGDADEAFTVRAGDSYVFAGNEVHSARAQTDAELVECFTPARDEYAD